MERPRTIDRRTFLADLGRGTFAVAILGIVGCSPSAVATSTPSPARSAGAGPGTSPSGAPPESRTPGGPPSGGPLTWARVDLDFVSAYLLVRGGEAALVDTGSFDSSDEIEAVLTGLGIGWPAVAHVILTHKHSDHVGSIGKVLERAPEATAYIGPEDMAALPGLALQPAVDGDTIFDLRVIGTPGHTPGSISVLDAAAGVLVAGDALQTEDGLPALPSARFTASMDQAKASIARLAALEFEALLVGHGDPIEAGASVLVAELAAGA